MSDLSLISIFFASLLGSAHCAGMCGPLMLATSKTPLNVLIYQLGRWIGYLALGVVAGALGQQFIRVSQDLSGLVFAFFFLFAGLRLIFSGSAHFSFLKFHQIFNSIQNVLNRSAGRSGGGMSLAMGASSAFLPCGWLHLFLLTALSSGSPIQGGLILTVFWAGGVPGLLLSGALMRRVKRLWDRHFVEANRRWIKITPGLILIGVATIILFERFNLGGQDLVHWCRTKIFLTGPF